MIKLNRIGNKLGLAGFLGVIFAGGMLANQFVSERAIELANKQAHSHQAISFSTVLAREAMQRMQLGVRDVRLARSTLEAEKSFNAIIDAQQAASQQLDIDISKALKPENRDRFQKIKLHA